MHSDRETNRETEKQVDSNIYDLVYRTQAQVGPALHSPFKAVKLRYLYFSIPGTFVGEGKHQIQIIHGK